jgi:hypothetical protein
MYAFIYNTLYSTIPNERKKKLERGTHPTQPCWLGESSVPVKKKWYTLLVLTFTPKTKRRDKTLNIFQNLPVEGN